MVVIFTSQPIFAASPLEGTQERDTNGIAWLYDSPLTVSEEITAIDGGLYQYSYSFLNTDSKHIWHFAVYTDFVVEEISRIWTDYSDWGILHIDDFDANLVEEYDPREYYPNLITSVACYGPNWPDTTEPINPGSYVSGFSYTTSVLDSGPKFYIYETVEDGYAGDTGFIAAVGLTEAGVVATQESTWGEVKSLYR